MALHDGRVTVEGVAVESDLPPTTTLFPVAVNEARYDVDELSVSSYAPQVSRGESADTAIFAFVSRAFRHSGSPRPRGPGHGEPRGSEGPARRRPGRPDDRRAPAARPHEGRLWRARGGRPLAHPRARFGRAARASRARAARGHGRRARRGWRDAARPDARGRGRRAARPDAARAFLEGDARILRLFPDVGAAERDPHARTGFFPITHLIAARLGARRLPDGARGLRAIHPGLRDPVPARLVRRDQCAPRLPGAVGEDRRGPGPEAFEQGAELVGDLDAGRHQVVAAAQQRAQGSDGVRGGASARKQWPSALGGSAGR